MLPNCTENKHSCVKDFKAVCVIDKTNLYNQLICNILIKCLEEGIIPGSFKILFVMPTYKSRNN